ncbi:hypothetical protein OF846_000502 [Rhodotorula toruloides]|nr:hypothetical protein OF846_000502 [Rhodotorula toruloides]
MSSHPPLPCLLSPHLPSHPLSHVTMLDATTVQELRKMLQSAQGAGDAKTCLDVLEKLDKGVVATEELLRETKIGVTVNKVAQSASSPEVTAKAKALVQKWRSAVLPKEGRSMSRALLCLPSEKREAGLTEGEGTFAASVSASASTSTTIKKASSPPAAESKSSQVKEEKPRWTTATVSPPESTSSSPTVPRPSLSTRRPSLPATTSTPPAPLKRPASATPDPDLAPPASKKARESAPPARTHETDSVCFDKIFPGATGKGKKSKGGESEDEGEKKVGKAGKANKVRASCCEALYDAIACDSTAETKTLAAKAIEIEQAVWDQNLPSDKMTPTQAYRTKVRFLYQNLKTPGNRTLRMKVVDGEFEVAKLVVCSSADFRTAEQKALEEEVQKRSLQNACFDATSTLGEAMRETMKWRGGGRRCGEITTGERCKCGGTSKETVTKALFGSATSDRWSQRYVSRSPPKSPSPAPPDAKTFPTATTPLGTPSRTLVAPARPPSPTKLAQSFLQQDDGELSSVFGSVLSPKDNWQCAACTSKFRQEEVIYPHPDAKGDASLAEVFFCRQCFAERFRKGNCKKCKYAVLSDAPFVKHDGNLWHEACYTCSYCEDPSTSPVIDFAGLPSCEACFDSEAYKTRGIPPSPHLSQSEWGKKPVSVLPPPSKWGRPSLPSASLGTAKKSNVWTSKAAPASSASIPNDEKPKAWRVRAERDKSPIAPSLDELGTRLRQAGLADPPSQASFLKPGVTSTGASSKPASTASSKSSPFARPASPVKTSSRPASPNKSVFASGLTSPTKPTSSPARPALAPVQPTANPPRPLPSPVQPSSPTKLPSSAPRPTPAPADPDACPICHRELGYGEFVELPKTSQVMHRDCFRCGGCEERLGTGKYVEAEGRWWHQQCAPAPKRYRTIITSLAEPDATSEDATTPDPPLTAELDTDDPACSGCGRPLGYGQSVTIPRSGKSFHTDCFCCAGCSGALGTQRGERGFVEVAGLPYHQKCAPPPASPSPAILASPFFASDALSSSRSTRLPTLPSFPPKHAPPPSAPSNPREPSIFSRLRPPPSNLGGHLLCAGCSSRATEKELVLGPRGRRYHRHCLRCEGCARGLDSECRVGEDGGLRCEACRKTATKPNYSGNFTSSTPLASSSPVSPRRF